MTSHRFHPSQRFFIVGVALCIVANGCSVSAGREGPRLARATAVASAAAGPASSPAATYLGNSHSSGKVGSIPQSLMDLAVSSDGVLVSGSSWAENAHDARVYDTTGSITGTRGYPLGPYTQTRSSGGIYGVAVDWNYIYAISGLDVIRYSRADWLDPANVTWADNGSNTGVSPLAVDPIGPGHLMGIAVCGSYLYVSDPGNGAGLLDHGDTSPNTSQIKQIGPLSPTGLGSVTRSWTVPRARTLTCDRDGDIWVLQQAVSGRRSAAAPAAARYTPNGTLLAKISLRGEPLDIAADPKSDHIYATDDGRDQDVKIYDYSGKVTGTIGVRGGYLARTPGLLGPLRFCGPRSVAIDGSGDVYIGQSGLPGVGQEAWSDPGPIAIISELAPNHSTQLWSDYAAAFADVGSPSSNGTRFYGRHMEYILSRGRYQPYAYTVDPYTYPWDNRIGADGDVYGQNTRVWDADGHRYLMMVGPFFNLFRIYMMKGDIAEPVVAFNNNTTLTTNHATARVDSNPRRNNVATDWWLDDAGNVWSVGGGQIWRYRLQGFQVNGTPRYDFHHVDVYPLPGALSQGVRRIVVAGHDIWMSGFAPDDPNPSADWDGWKSLGRHLVEYTSLPTRSRWPEPSWKRTLAYPAGNSSQFSYPTSFAVGLAQKQIALGWLYSNSTNQGFLQLYSSTTGTPERTIDPPAPTLGSVGWFDMMRSLNYVNGWIWAEDDLNGKIFGICVLGHPVVTTPRRGGRGRRRGFYTCTL